MANNVAVVRKYKGYSQIQLAKKAGISRQALIDIENNSTASPKLDTSQRLAKELGVSIEQLFFAKDVHLGLQGIEKEGVTNE